MVNKGIIEAYRKMDGMGFSKKEVQDVFYSSTWCFDKLNNYFYLNEALNQISGENLPKKDLGNTIKEVTFSLREKSKLENNFSPFNFESPFS